jgi:hypothetical protein
MIQYVKVLFWTILFGLVVLPCYASAASITEKNAAIGQSCIASGENSTAMGYQTAAIGEKSTAMGDGTIASGWAATAMGSTTQAGGIYSTAMGVDTTALGYCSFSGGGYMKLEDTADHTFVWGNSVIEQSIAIADAFLIFPAGTPGKVGIGTKNPKNLLDLGMTLGKKLAVYQNSAGNDFYGFSISDYTLEIYAGATSDDNNPAIVVKSVTGRIGIGTNSPNYLLEVDGNAAKSSGGTTWINSSDARLKDITGDYDRGLDQILSLKPVTFYYKDGNPRGLPTDEENIGFIAQEVQEVFPEAISEGEDGYLDFNMHPVNVALVNAVKELKSENDALRQEIKQIKSALGL